MAGEHRGAHRAWADHVHPDVAALVIQVRRPSAGERPHRRFGGRVDALGGVVLNEEDDLSETLHSCERAVELEPDNVPALNEQGHVLAMMGDHTRAAEAVREATNHDAKFATARYNLGTSLHALTRPQEAREAFLMAVEADPEFYPALNTLGVLARSEGNDQEALAFFRRAIAANPAYAKPWFNIGNLYEISDQHHKAGEAYQRALDIDPDYALARASLDRLAGQGW
jgi:tetratricopeptide (TPR) repeat protein